MVNKDYPCQTIDKRYFTIMIALNFRAYSARNSCIKDQNGVFLKVPMLEQTVGLQFCFFYQN